MIRNDTQRLFEQIRKVIDLPENCRSLVLRMSVDAIPTIETERFVKGEDPITERFRVVLIEDEKSPGGHKFVDGVCGCGQKTTDDPVRCPIAT
jgi:hypothetical protein